MHKSFFKLSLLFLSFLFIADVKAFSSGPTPGLTRPPSPVITPACGQAGSVCSGGAPACCEGFRCDPDLTDPNWLQDGRKICFSNTINLNGAMVPSGNPFGGSGTTPSPGSVANGGYCHSNADCQSGLCNIPTNYTIGACAVPPPSPVTPNEVKLLKDLNQVCENTTAGPCTHLIFDYNKDGQADAMIVNGDIYEPVVINENFQDKVYNPQAWPYYPEHKASPEEKEFAQAELDSGMSFAKKLYMDFRTAVLTNQVVIGVNLAGCCISYPIFTDSNGHKIQVDPFSDGFYLKTGLNDGTPKRVITVTDPALVADIQKQLQILFYLSTHDKLGETCCSALP